MKLKTYKVEFKQYKGFNNFTQESILEYAFCCYLTLQQGEKMYDALFDLLEVKYMTVKVVDITYKKDPYHQNRILIDYHFEDGTRWAETGRITFVKEFEINPCWTVFKNIKGTARMIGDVIGNNAESAIKQFCDWFYIKKVSTSMAKQSMALLDGIKADGSKNPNLYQLIPDVYYNKKCWNINNVIKTRDKVEPVFFTEKKVENNI